MNGARSILSAHDADHSRIRRLLVHGFSEKALRDQEPLIQSYVELFITRLLQKTSAAGDGTAKLNIAQWFNFITFDIIGDLSFGESFHCLENSNYHPWIAILFSHFKALALSTCSRFFPFIERLMLYAVPKAVKQQRIDHFNMSKEKVHQRIAAQQSQTWRNADFMAHVLRHNDEKGMSLSEIEATFGILVVAGSETTATALAGIMNYLLKDSAVLEPLVYEIRSCFTMSSEITLDRVGSLQYLNAVIEEGLRLCQPVPLGSPRRVPPGGATVCGHWIPENVSSKPTSILGLSPSSLVVLSPRRVIVRLSSFHFLLLPPSAFSFLFSPSFFLTSPFLPLSFFLLLFPSFFFRKIFYSLLFLSSISFFSLSLLFSSSFSSPLSFSFFSFPLPSSPFHIFFFFFLPFPSFFLLSIFPLFLFPLPILFSSSFVLLPSVFLILFTSQYFFLLGFCIIFLLTPSPPQSTKSHPSASRFRPCPIWN